MQNSNNCILYCFCYYIYSNFRIKIRYLKYYNYSETVFSIVAKNSIQFDIKKKNIYRKKSILIFRFLNYIKILFESQYFKNLIFLIEKLYCRLFCYSCRVFLILLLFFKIVLYRILISDSSRYLNNICLLILKSILITKIFQKFLYKTFFFSIFRF